MSASSRSTWSRDGSGRWSGAASSGGAGGRTRRRRWPARSRPTRISPSRPVEAHGLAAQLEHVHGGVDHRPRGVLGGERRGRVALRRREQPVVAHDVRVPRATRDAASGRRSRGCAVRRGRRPSPAAPAPRPRPCRGRPRAGARRRPGSPAPTPPSTLATSVSGPSPSSRNATRAPRLMIGSTPRSARRDRRGLPAPRGPDGRAEQRLERERRRGLAPEDPRGRVVGPREPLDDRSLGRGADDEPDLRADTRVGEVGGLELQRPERRRAPLLDHRRRRPLDEAAQVVAEPRRDGAPGAALEPLDEAPDEPHAVLERQPRVALAPVGAGRQAHVAAGDAQRRDAAGRGREPARRARGRGAPPGAGRPRSTAPGGRPRSARGSPRARRAGGACGGRAARRRATRRPRGRGTGR